MHALRIIHSFMLVCTATIPVATQKHESDPKEPQFRETVKLDGDWTVSLDDRKTWHPIKVPGTIEDQIDVNFDGISIYRKTIPARSVEKDRQLLLEFMAVATTSEIRINGQVVGRHTGGWTPFYVDLTEFGKTKTSKEQPWTIEVICDERVGHNTQGFLPVFAPHFGGIWKSVNLIDAPSLAIDHHRANFLFNSSTRTLEIELPVMGSLESKRVTVQTSIRRRGTRRWIRLQDARLISEGQSRRTKPDYVAAKIEAAKLKASLPLVSDEGQSLPIQLEPWSPVLPALYDVRVELRGIEHIGHTSSPESRDRFETFFAVREFKTHQDQLRLNGKAISVRGLLNWGYAPPGNAPSLDEAFMRNEIEIAKSRGFNLMKFCLWIPPKRYLQLCDELGMLVWIEYPAWHPDFSPSKLPALRREYDEFFHYDRVHPSVILRSLTCETGPTADIHVVRELYDLCKKRIPGAVVEDDSSWIAWNRVHDFYDDHPYGNNHTWMPTLDRLKNYISDRETKPLILGECMAADTWCDPQPLLDMVGDKRPFWLPQFMEGNVNWLEQIKPITAADTVDHLLADSRHYAMLMRKYQIESFRREVPYGGYVVSVIRDIPFCGMGLVDYLGRQKQSADNWNWHGDTMLLLKTDNDRRSFRGDSVAETQLYISHFGEAAEDCTCVAKLLDASGRPLIARKTLQFGAISSGLNGPYPLRLELPMVTGPTHCTLDVEATVGGQRVCNRWPIWIVPDPMFDEATIVTFHGSIRVGNCAGSESQDLANANRSCVFITHVVDSTVIEHLVGGGNVLLLPNNSPGSLPTRTHWFLRGAPIIDQSKILADVPRELLLELQHFDLASDVVPEIQSYVDLVQPVLLLWDNHDLKHVLTHGLIYRIPFPSGGSILVSAINHQDSAAGQFLLARLIEYQSKTHDTKTNQRHQQLLDRLVRESRSRSIRLDQCKWKFSPDPTHDGHASHWHRNEFDDSRWNEIRTTAHWESQGYDTLDDWAWYRIKVKIPRDWPAKTGFLNFTGVDDHYKLYVDGEFVGQSGDIDKRITAFEERKSFDIAKWIQPDEDLQIAIEVYDWYGAGGIFRPVTLTTEPLSDQPRILK